MQLETLDIDKYIGWYKDLSGKVETCRDTQYRYNRINALYYMLHIRHVKDPTNKRSLDCSIAAKKEIEQMQVLRNEVGIYADKSKHYFFPSGANWHTFDFLNKSGFEALTEQLQSKINSSATPEIEILQSELKRKNEEEAGNHLLTFVTTGTPIIAAAVEDIERFPFVLADLVSNIHYCRYLAGRISPKEIDTPPKTTIPEAQTPTAPRLQWKGESMELFVLFSDMEYFNLIEGTKADIARLICENFTDKNGKSFTFSNVQTKLNSIDSSKDRKTKRADFSKLL